jgi:hypothetical protein
MNNNEFVRVIDNFCAPEKCKKFIKLYEELDRTGFTMNRKKNFAHDKQVALHEAMYNGFSHEIQGQANICKQFTEAFFNGPYKEYSNKYHVLNDFQEHTIKYIKLQKTLPGQGYHGWHAEDGAKHTAKRLFTFTLYLNDVKEGGETEFLYLSKRIKAVEGRMAFFPGSFEYTHRGNPPISNEKYILTGWVEFL